MRRVRHTGRLLEAARSLPKLGTLLAPVGCAVVLAACGSASKPAASTAIGGGSASSSSAAPGDVGAQALAFSRCMRTNGVSNFPDPSPSGGFDLHNGSGNISSPAFRVAQARCQKLLPGGGPPGPGAATHPSAQTLAKLLKIARCMHQQGVTQFPEPRTSVPSNPLAAGVGEVTDFDGAILLFPRTMNMQAPAYRQALAACGAPPLGLNH